ncbi:MAG: transglycosylase SLT domain-containing protein [Ilumatobacteraceae bacterium]
MPIIERVVAAIVAAIIAIAVGGGSSSSSVAYPTQIQTLVTATAAPAPPTVPTTVPPTSTTVEAHVEVIEPRYDLPVIPGMETALCGHWWRTALEVGWKEEHLPVIDRIMWNETRCQHDAVSPTKDYGLMQINKSVWESVAAEHGWSMEDLLIPQNGLAMGIVVYNAALDAGWCGFQPWFMSGEYCR